MKSNNLQETSMDNSIEPGGALKRLFLILLTASLGLWGYVVLTTTIDRVPISDFPILYMMPAAYWIGAAMLILATVIWYFSPETRWYHFLLLLPWTLYIFVGPQLIEASLRGYDLHVCRVIWIEHREITEYWDYKYWLSFPILSDYLYRLTDVGYYSLNKLVSTSLNLLRPLFICYLGTCLFSERKPALLFSLVLLGSMWSLDVSPQHLGILMMFCLLALCFSPGQLDMRRRGLIITLFAVLVMTHVLTSFITAILLVLLCLMSLLGKDLGYNRDIKGYALATLSVVMFTSYLMYTAGGVFTTAVDRLVTAIREPFGILGEPASFLTPYSPLQAHCWHLVYIFYGVLLVWGLIIVARKEFWTHLSWKRLFPLLLLIPFALVCFVAYSNASLPRFYLFAIPFIVWFLVRESRNLKKFLVPLFLIPLLILSFVEYTSMEYAVYTPTEEIAGAKFVCSKIPRADWVYYVCPADPSPQFMANVVEGPVAIGRIGYRGERLIWRYYTEGDVQFAVWSTRQRNLLLFHHGEEGLAETRNIMYRDDHNIIYTNGDLQIYAVVYRGHFLRH